MIINKDYLKVMREGKRIDKVLLQRENNSVMTMFWCMFGAVMLILTIIIMEVIK